MLSKDALCWISKYTYGDFNYPNRVNECSFSDELSSFKRDEAYTLYRGLKFETIEELNHMLNNRQNTFEYITSWTEDLNLAESVASHSHIDEDRTTCGVVLKVIVPSSLVLTDVNILEEKGILDDVGVFDKNEVILKSTRSPINVEVEKILTDEDFYNNFTY